MDDIEAQHVELLKLDRLEWLRDTMATIYAREIAEPGYMSDWQAEALHSSVLSWVTRVLALDVPA